MYMDNDERVKELLDESSGIMGMIAEAKMKARILKQRSKDEEALGGEPSVALLEAVSEGCERMSHDLATYRSRLSEIHEELQSYGAVSEMDEDEGVFWPEDGY